MKVLVGGIVFIIEAIAFACFFWRLLRDATFLHLVLITVFIFVESFLKWLVSLLLMISNPILIQQVFDFACCLVVISDGSASELIIMSLLVFFNSFFEFFQLLIVNFFLIDVLLVLFGFSLDWMTGLDQKWWREGQRFSSLSIIKMVLAYQTFVLREWTEGCSIVKFSCKNPCCFSNRWLKPPLLFFLLFERKGLAVVLFQGQLMVVALKLSLFSRITFPLWMNLTTAVMALLFDYLIEFVQILFDAIDFLC